jgi:hypothetical protein
VHGARKEKHRAQVHRLAVVAAVLHGRAAGGK